MTNSFEGKTQTCQLEQCQEFVIEMALCKARQTFAQPKNLHNPAQAQNVATKSGSKVDKFSGIESNRTEVQKGWGIYF